MFGNRRKHSSSCLIYYISYHIISYHITNNLTNAQLQFQAKGRRLAAENQFKRTVHYIHGWNLPKDYKLKVEHVQHENRTLLPESHMQYQLIPAKQCEPQVYYSYLACLGICCAYCEILLSCLWINLDVSLHLCLAFLSTLFYKLIVITEV